MADVKPAPVPWLWSGRVPFGRLTLLSGPPGVGKSFFTCDLAARVSRGHDWPDGGPAPVGDTLLICAEDDPADTIAPRLTAAGADLNRVQALRAAILVEETGQETSVEFDLRNVDLIRESLDRMTDCRLVVIDPVGSYMGDRTDTYRDNEVRGVLAPLAMLAAERGVAVMLVAHTRKAVAGSADDAVLGSRAFVGIARVALHLSADARDRDRRRLLPGKINIGPAAAGLAFRIVGNPSRLEWEASPLYGLHADDVLSDTAEGEARRGPKPAKLDAAAEWLVEMLSTGPVLVADVAAQAKSAGLSWRTVRRASEFLDVRPRKEKGSFSGKWHWELPTSGQNPGHDRTRSSSENPGQLREATTETPGVRTANAEDGQEDRNSATFGINANPETTVEGEL